MYYVNFNYKHDFKDPWLALLPFFFSLFPLGHDKPRHGHGSFLLRQGKVRAKFVATTPCVVLVAPPIWAWEEMALCEGKVGFFRRLEKGEQILVGGKNPPGNQHIHRYLQFFNQ